MPDDFKDIQPSEDWSDLKPSEAIHADHLNALEVGAKTVGHALYSNLIEAPWGVGQALGQTLKDPFQGKIPGQGVVTAIGKEIADKQARATVEGRTWYPGEETIQNIKQGWQQNDPDKLSQGLGDILGVLAPESLRFLPGSKLGLAGADLARISAARNYEKIFNPLRTGEEGASLAPTIQKTARGLANAPETIRGGPAAVGAQLEAARAKYGPLTEGRDPTANIPLGPIKQNIEDALNKDIYVQGSITQQVKNPTALKLKNELFDMLDRSAGQNPSNITPGLVKAPLVSEKAMDDIKDMFNARAKGKDVVMKTAPTTAIGDDAKWERVMANHLSDALDGVNNVADRVESNYNLFATAKRLYQSGRNRAYIEKSEGGLGLPIALGGGGGARLIMPKGIKNMVDGIRWNTVAGDTKKSIATSMATGNWKKAISLLQLTKLGVPTSGSYGQ